MVDFLPKNTFDPNAPNWTGASQKPDASNYRANKTMETLFSGVADLAGGAVQSTYNYIVDKAKKTWNGELEPVRDAQGVGAVSDAAPIGLSTPGAGLTQDGRPKPIGSIPAQTTESMAEQAGKLKAAHADGRISDSYYYSQLTALTKKVKSQFPGFQDEVDAIVQKSTGVVPANALRNAVLSELDRSKTQADKQREDQDKRRKELFQQYATPAQMQKFRETGEIPSLTEMEATAFPKIREEAAVESEKKQLALARSRGENTSEEGLRSATRSANAVQEQVFKEALENAGGADSVLVKALKGGKPLSAQETAQVISQFKAFQLAYEQRIRQVYQGFSEYINDPSKVESAVKMHVARLESIEKALGAGDYTLAAMSAKNMQLEQNSEAARLWNSAPGVRAISTLNSVPGIKEAVPLILQNPNNQMLGKAVRDANDYFATQMISGANPGQGKSSITQAIEHHAATSGGVQNIPRGAARDILGRGVTVLTSDQVPAEARARAALDIFSDQQLLSKFSEKTYAFQQLTSPAVTAQMAKLKDSHPQAYGAYVTWVKSNFQKVALFEGNKIAAAADERYFTVAFDPTSNRFVPQLTPDGLKYANQLRQAASTPAGRQSMEQDSDPLKFLVKNDAAIREYARTIASMNGMIESVAPVLKNGGYDPGQEMKTIFEQWGITTKKANPNAAGFWSRLGTAVGNAVKSPMAADTGDTPIKSFGGQPLNFQTSSGDDLGSGGQGARLTQQARQGVRVASVGNAAVPVKGAPDLGNLSGPAKKLIEGLDADGVLEEAAVTSGYRDPARNKRAKGAKASQHLQGNAVDLDVSKLTDEQKAKVLEAAIARGAKGIGIYPGGRSIHIDMRQDSPATWGPGAWGRFKGVDISEQPAWAQPALRKMFGQK